MQIMEHCNDFFEGYPELSLIVTLLQSALGREFKASANKTPIDFKKLLLLSVYHGVASRVREQLAMHQIQMPCCIKGQWDQYCQQSVAKSLNQTAELIRLAKRLESSTIPFLPLKGPVLAFQLEQGVNYRVSGDLDIIIKPSNMEQVAETMKQEGYLQTLPEQELSPKQHAFFIKHHKHFCFYHPRKNILVECHWKWTSNPYLLKITFEEAYERKQTQEVFGHSFPTLSNEDNFLYLTTHAACHAWYRLFWLWDLALLAPQIENWPALYKKACDHKLERPFLEGVLLLDQFFNLPNQTGTTSNSKHRRLINLALQSIIRNSGSGSDRPFWHWVLEKRHLLMLDKRMRFKTSLILGQLGMSPKDWATLHLPDTLFFLYYPLRPFLWAKRWFGR